MGGSLFLHCHVTSGDAASSQSGWALQMLSSRGQASGMTRLWRPRAALNGWAYSGVGWVNPCASNRVASTVRVPACASSSLHSCCKAAISLSFDSSASACWARSRARWRANALLYCSADPGLIREGEFTCKRTKRNYLHMHTLCVFANLQHSKGWGEPGVPLPATSFSTNIQYIVMYSSRPWDNVCFFSF